MKKILFFAVLGALGTTLFTSCSNEDALNPEPNNKDIAADYAAAFKAKFGETTTFNTVKSVDVTAQIPDGTGSYTLRVYDGYPSAKSGAQMIGKFENLQPGSTIVKKVNCPGNAERLFFTAEKNGLSMVSNCAVKNNKVVARFNDEGESYSGIEGTFNLEWSPEYAQFAKAFYDGLPNALTSIAGLFNEGDDHRDASADAYFFFNEDNEVVFYPIFMCEEFEDEVGYFIYDTNNNEIVEEGILIDNTQATNFLWEGTVDGPSSVYPKYQDAQGVSFKRGNGYMYSQPYIVTVPEGFDSEGLVVGITISNDARTKDGQRTKSGMNGNKFYSISSLNPLNNSEEPQNIQVAVYAAGKIEIQNETADGVTTTTGTFGLVGIEDNILDYPADHNDAKFNSDWDMNDIVLYTEATQATSIEFEKPAKYFVAFEDLGGTYDFDFNDVVLEIDYVSGWEIGSVKCLAAGGTLPVEVFYDGEAYDMTPRGQDDAVSIWGEIHDAFGEDVTTVINTIPEGMNVKNLNSATCEPLNAVFFFGEDFLIQDDGIPFYLVVDGKFGQKRIAAKGPDGTPQAIVIGTTWTRYPGTWDEEQNYVEGEKVTDPEFTYWQWPIECVDVEAAYPDIKTWITNPDNLGWLQTGVSSNLY